MTTHRHAPAVRPTSASTPGSAETPVEAPTPDVVVSLEARPGRWTVSPGRPALEGWTYNGSVPGPVIEARVGDLLEVRLTNHLDEPTTVHWHGLRLPPPMDGTERTQAPVPPGGTFTYRFRLPDAGTFWYHPHANETVQLERGLYGAMVVRGPDEPEMDGDRVLVLDDVRLDRKGRIAPPGGWLERHNGREGKVLLVNGCEEPSLDVRAGTVERWRLVNAASARYFRVSLGGSPFQILATDGGLLEAPVAATEILLAPGDRAELAVGPFGEGSAPRLLALPYDRGLGRAKAPRTLAHVRVGPPAPSRARIPARLREIPPLATPDAVPNREVRLSGRTSLRRGVDFLVNGEPHHHAPPARVGELQVWDVVNETPLDHPFHLHGFFFQVLSVDGAPPPFRSWEDTVNVPPRSRVRIAWLPDDRPGPWMYHCHILEHHAAGMMAHFEVVR